MRRPAVKVAWPGGLLAAGVAGGLAGLAALGLAGARLRFGSLSGSDLPRAALLHGLLGIAAGLLVFLLARALVRRASVALWISVAGLAAAAVLFARWNARERCDVLLLISDATRADHLSVYGYSRDTTPELTALAGECVIWEQMIAAGASTIVSTPTILTGLYPTQHGMTDHSKVLADSARTIAQRLQDAGYVTYGHTTNPHLKSRQGFARGFDIYDERGTWQTEAAEVFARYLQWYLARDTQAPAFGFLFLIDPHAPYTPPAEYLRLFDTLGEATPLALSGLSARGGPSELDAGSRARVIAHYDGELAFFDHCLGDLVRALRCVGRLDRTLLVYTADHGEELFDHGYLGHNTALYEESIHVPFVVRFPSPLRWPRIGPRGLRVAEPASHVDILPTILDYLRLPRDGVSNGANLLEAIGRPADPRAVYCEQIYGEGEACELYAWRTPEWKYTRTVRSQRELPGPEALYRLSEDPGEHVDVRARYPAKADELRTALDARLAALRASAPDSLAVAPLDEETRTGLRSLGYIE